MSRDDSKLIGETIRSKRRFDKRDFDQIASYIREEYERRRGHRKETEQIWDEVDRQLAMKPVLEHKYQPGTRNVDPAKQWLAEVELPLQAQTSEVLTADCRRMKFPDSGWWAQAIAEMTDDYLDRADLQSYVTGDRNEVPSILDQVTINKLVEGVMMHWEGQYDFAGHMDRIDAEAFHYGMGIAVPRSVKKSAIAHTARGTVPDNSEIPILVPRSIKDTYLDDSSHATMLEGHQIGPGDIFSRCMKIDDLRLAAAKGSSDPDRIDGGWMPKALNGLEGDDHRQIEVLEFVGDLVVPRRTVGSMFLPRAMVTIAYSEESAERVVRWRFWPYSFHPVLRFPYHYESLETPYAAGPLVKGWPIQASASQVLGRLLEVAALNSQPPISYDPTDPTFVSEGGPHVFPGAQWATPDGIEVHSRIGDAGALTNSLMMLLNWYEGMVGVNAPRLGAQTVSHTTAFAKEAELSRGTVRTVDYVRASLKGPMTQWLYMAYEMGRARYRTSTYLMPGMRAFVTVPKSGLPDRAAFEAFGSGAPSEKQAQMQGRMAALQMAIQMEQLRANLAQVEAQTGLPSKLDFDRAMEEVLRDGGWQDIDTILRGDAGVAGSGAPAGVPQAAGGLGPSTAPGTAMETLAALAAGGGA